MAKVGVILSGCGFQDGSEIYESVLVLRALAKRDIEYICMAPRVGHKDVINHINNEEMGETRDVFIEASRLARGIIEPVEDIESRDLIALILPGGFGAAKNLSTYAYDGHDCQVHPEVERIINDVHADGKPIAAICIAPVVVAKSLEGKNIKFTLGMDPKMKSVIESMGHSYMACDYDEVCVDKENKILSTPAYMVAENIAEADTGIELLMNELMNFLD